MAVDLSKRVAGMDGFRDYYVKGMSAADRAILSRFEQILKDAYIGGAQLLEREMRDGHEHP